MAKPKHKQVGATEDAKPKKRSTASTLFWGGLFLVGLSKLGKGK